MEGFTVLFQAFGKQSKNVILGFRVGINEIFGLLGFYADEISKVTLIQALRLCTGRTAHMGVEV